MDRGGQSVRRANFTRLYACHEIGHVRWLGKTNFRNLTKDDHFSKIVQTHLKSIFVSSFEFHKNSLFFHSGADIYMRASFQETQWPPHCQRTRLVFLIGHIAYHKPGRSNLQVCYANGQYTGILYTMGQHLLQIYYQTFRSNNCNLH